MTARSRKLSTCLWFNDQAEAAAAYYEQAFGQSSIGNVSHYDAATAEISGQPEGTVMAVDLNLADHRFVGLNGGPGFQFTPAISFFVNSHNQDETNRLWDRLIDGGEALMPLGKYPFSERFGWVQDRFGVSWQLMCVQDDFKQKIVPCLMFVGDNCGKAEDALRFYTSVFNGEPRGPILRYEAGQEPDHEGTVAHAEFELVGQMFSIMDSAHPHDFAFSEAISFMVNCETQAEIDRYWNALSAVPEAEQCGWLKDQFGVSWQIVPRDLEALLADPDPDRARRATEAMLRMKKFDIAGLKSAARGG